MNVVEIAAVVGLVLNSRDAGAGEGIGGKCTVGEVGTDLGIDTVTRRPAKLRCGGDFLLADGILGLWWSVVRGWTAWGCGTYAGIGAERARLLVGQGAGVN